MQQIMIILHVLFALSIIGLVLLQHGKGADVGATFGSGASNTMFGSQGSMPFLMKLTVLLAALFFATSLGLTYLVAHMERSQRMSTPSLKHESSNVPNGVMNIPSSTPSKKN
ncbi:MAG: preprotein translocase subunit SecG [Gammaproteobacteria bacterium]|nr:preprotein translocase subunit SecG [Gammaproteobacteria bacterium]MCH9743342.1 preprotein translocase subunit SecG [Gammaproteobacteria bacterium]